MALKSADQAIRWIQRIGMKVWNSKVVMFLRDVIAAFFNIQSEDQSLTKGGKVAGLISRRILYMAIDAMLVVISIGLVVWVQEIGGTFLQAYFVTWAYDFIVAGILFAYYQDSGNDLSIGSDLRRATDVAGKRSRIAGYLGIAFTMFMAIVWSGPEKIVIFFQKELKTDLRTGMTILALTSIQAVVYTPAYWYGYGLLKMAADGS